MRRFGSAFMMAMLAIVLSIGVAQSEWFCPYVPDSRDVQLLYWERSGISYVNISVVFASRGYDISSWGTPIAMDDGGAISVDAEIWRFMGYSLPVVTTVFYTYSLGALSVGEYDFFFRVWCCSVENTTFVVSREIIVPDDDLEPGIFDVVLVSSAYLSTPSDPNWNACFDLVEPYGIIDIFDVVLMTGSYGEEYTP